MATGKKTGGRTRGTPNKTTLVRNQELAAGGELPLDYMLRVMRDQTYEHVRRDEMAKAAAPYVHARLAPVDPKGNVADERLVVQFIIMGAPALSESKLVIDAVSR